jgi:lipoprotein-releasing system ATP-binding protein
VKDYRHPTHAVSVLKGLDLDVEVGEVVAIVGASGVGKSTLLNIIGTLDRPDSGSVIIEEEDVFSLGERALARFRNSRIGFVFQLYNLLPEFSAAENVMLPAMIGGRRAPEIRNIVWELLRDVGLEERAHHKPGELSGGEQQRVALARALVNRPRMVLADEPSGNLDKKNGERLFELFGELSAKRTQSFVIATHNESLARMASRVLKLEDGILKS